MDTSKPANKHDAYADWILERRGPPHFRSIRSIALDLQAKFAQEDEAAGVAPDQRRKTSPTELGKWLERRRRLEAQWAQYAAPMLNRAEFGVRTSPEGQRRRATDPDPAAEASPPKPGRRRQSAPAPSSPNPSAAAPASQAATPASVPVSGSKSSESKPAVSRQSQTNAAPAQGAGNAGEADSGSEGESRGAGGKAGSGAPGLQPASQEELDAFMAATEPVPSNRKVPKI